MDYGGGDKLKAGTIPSRWDHVRKATEGRGIRGTPLRKTGITLRSVERREESRDQKEAWGSDLVRGREAQVMACKADGGENQGIYLEGGMPWPSSQQLDGSWKEHFLQWCHS